MTNYALEIATFRAELTPEFFKTRAAAMEAIERSFDGFITSRLISNDDGTLADEVVWASREIAEEAARNASSVAEAAAYFSLITEVVSMEHAEIIQ